MFNNWRRTPLRWRCWRRRWQPWLRPWEPCRWQSQPWQHHSPPRQHSGEGATDAKRWVTWPNTARRDKVKGETRGLHCQMPNSGGWVNGSTPHLRGQCPETLMEVDGKAVMAVIDTGSEVSTVTKSWFDEHLRGRPLQQTSWLSVKVANGLDIPYVGLLEGRIRVFGQECHASILVIKDTACPLTRSRRRQTLALLGMNILQQLLPTGQKTPPPPPECSPHRSSRQSDDPALPNCGGLGKSCGDDTRASRLDKQSSSQWCQTTRPGCWALSPSPVTIPWLTVGPHTCWRRPIPLSCPGGQPDWWGHSIARSDTSCSPPCSRLSGQWHNSARCLTNAACWCPRANAADQPWP